MHGVKIYLMPMCLAIENIGIWLLYKFYSSPGGGVGNLGLKVTLRFGGKGPNNSVGCDLVCRSIGVVSLWYPPLIGCFCLLFVVGVSVL